MKVVCEECNGKKVVCNKGKYSKCPKHQQCEKCRHSIKCPVCFGKGEIWSDYDPFDYSPSGKYSAIC